jgi:hypothetical protein
MFAGDTWRASPGTTPVDGSSDGKTCEPQRMINGLASR